MLTATHNIKESMKGKLINFKNQAKVILILAYIVVQPTNIQERNPDDSFVFKTFVQAPLNSHL